MGKLIPIVLALVGLGGGVGAGILLRPDPAEQKASDMAVCPPTAELPASEVPEDTGPTEFVKFSNQFVIPVLEESKVDFMVVLSISLEVVEGSTEAVYAREPKLRDAFLRVLFDHAIAGQFDGNFMHSAGIAKVRSVLASVAEQELGDIVVDVLIVDVLKQDV